MRITGRCSWTCKFQSSRRSRAAHSLPRPTQRRRRKPSHCRCCCSPSTRRGQNSCSGRTPKGSTRPKESRHRPRQLGQSRTRTHRRRRNPLLRCSLPGRPRSIRSTRRPPLTTSYSPLNKNKKGRQQSLGQKIKNYIALAHGWLLYSFRLSSVEVYRVHRLEP